MSKRMLLVVWVVMMLAWGPAGTDAASQLQDTPVGFPIGADRRVRDHDSGTRHSHKDAGQPRSAPVAMAGTPTIHVTSPTDGQVLNVRDVEVSYQVTDHVIGPIGTPHLHIHLDGDAIPFMIFNGDDPTAFGQESVLFDFDLTSRATWVNATTIRLNALSNGQHTLQFFLVDGNHNRLANAEAAATVTFSVNVPPDDATAPPSLVFVKEQRGENGMDRRVFDHEPNIVCDLYLLTPVQPDGTVTQLTDVARDGGGVLGPEVSWDSQRILFAMRQHENDTWHIWEMNMDGTGLHQITFDPPYQAVNDLDPAYLPDGQIIFASDRLKQRDEYNVTLSTQLYVVNADGSDLHLIEPNPSHNLNPQVIRDGRVTFDRWDHLAHRNKFTAWHMNQDGSSGFVFFGGASPRSSDRLGNAQGIERRELVDGEMVGIFTDRNQLPGTLAIFDNRNGNLEDLPRPITLGPDGLYRTPHPLTTHELVYSYSPGEDPAQGQFGLYTMPWTPEAVLVDDQTASTATGAGAVNYAFRTYKITLDAPGRVYVEVTGRADDNGEADDDDLWVLFDGLERKTLERQLNGDLDRGLPKTFRVDADLEAGEHLIQFAADETPTVTRVRIVRGVRGGTPALLYDDPGTDEVSPIPVRARTRPPIYPSKVNRDLDWGVFLVRDISLRGDFRQPNFTSPEGDPDYPFHMDLSRLRGLRVFQSIPRRGRNTELLAGSHTFEAVRVLGVAEPNAFGTTTFQAPADNVTAWDLIGNDGAAIVHERVWSLVQPGEVRACGGCHVPPQFPFVQRDIGPIPPPTDLRVYGKVYTFVDDVLSILQDRCLVCHATTGSGQRLAGAPAGGLDLRGDRKTYDALKAEVNGRTPGRYLSAGDARKSFFFQLLTGDAKGDEEHQARIDAINADTDHTTLLTAEERFDIATWIDTGAGFAYLPDGERTGGPEAVGLLPRPGAAPVAQNTGVAIHFNAPIDRATVDATTFLLQQVGGADVSGHWHWGTNRDVLFRPDTPLPAGEYQVAIHGDVRDIKDEAESEALARAFQATFTVADGTDTAPPQVVPSVTDSNPASVSGPVVVRFNEPLDPGHITDHTLWVETEIGQRVEGRVALSADGLEAAFAPRFPLDKGTSYRLIVKGDVRDLAGNALGSDVMHAFTTAAAPVPQYHGLIAQRPAGNAPEKVAVSADGSRVLVANASSDTLSLFDGVTWERLKTYPDIGDAPHDVAFSPDGVRACVLNTGSDDVRVIRLSDGATLATIGGLGNAFLMAANPRGTRMYVTDTGDPDRLHELDIDPASASFGQVLRSLELGHEPYDVAVSPDGHLAVVSGQHGVSVIDLDLWAVRQFIEIRWGGLGEIALSPDGRQAYVTGRWRDVLYVIDLITGQPVVRLPMGSEPESVVAGPDGRFVYVAERGDKTVAVVDVGTLQVVRRLPAGVARIEGLAVSPDGRLIYATGGGWPGYLSAFHLGDLSDGVAPAVSRVRPGDQAADVPTFAPLLMDLTEAVDRLTANADTIQLEQNGITIHGTLAVSKDNRQVWFRPGAPLRPGTTYTLRVTDGVKDLAGNALSPETLVAFTTAAQPDPPPIGLWAAPEAGSNPRGVAVTPDGAQVLVTDYWGNRLRIIDASTWQETVLESGHRVGQIAISPDGKRAYVVRTEVNDVMVVDLTTRRPIDINDGVEGWQGIPVGSRPVSLVVHPSQSRLYVVNRDSGEVSVIDTQTNQEVARWPVNGIGPEDRDAYGVALGPDGRQLLVTSRQRLSILDAGDGHLVKQFDDLPGWSYYGVVVTPDGQESWVVSADSDEVLAIDLRVNEIVARVSVGEYPTWAALSPDGEWLYVSNRESGSVSVVHRRTATVLNTLPAGGGVYRLALSPDGQRLYVANDAHKALLVYAQADAADETGPAVMEVAPPASTQGLSTIAPLVVHFSEAMDRSSVNSSTFRVTQATGGLPNAGPAYEPLAEVAVEGTYLFSLDNRTVTFVPHGLWLPGTTYTLRLESGLTDMAGNPLSLPQTSQFRVAVTLDPPPVAERAETYASGGAVALALSPDASQLAVANTYWDTISLLSLDTWTVLAEVEVGDGPWGLSFNADGSRLYGVHERDGTLAVIDVLTGQVVQVFSGLPVDASHIVLSPDGMRAYVTGYHTGGIDAVDLSTGQVTRLHAMDNPGRPIFAADGTLYVPAKDRLWRRNGDGTWSDLYHGAGYVDQMALAADGRHAYLSATWHNRLVIVDLVLWRPVYSLAVGNAPGALAQTADGRLLMVGLDEPGGLQIIDGLTQATLQTVSMAGGRPAALVWDERRGRLYVGDPDAGKVRNFSIAYGSTSGTALADVSGDGKVDIDDVKMVAADWRTDDLAYDLNGDGRVNIGDMMYVVLHMGASGN